jgi:hypothetical protein
MSLFSSVINATEYYVKVNATGNGNGTSWDNAMSGESFVSKLADGFDDDDEIFIAGGIYRSQAAASYFISINKKLTITGGFDPNITGNATEITYPTSTPTTFSGDVNQDGVAGSGDSPVLYINSDVTLKGVRITGGYSTTANRPGIHVNNGNVGLYYCTVDENVTTTSASGDAGGAGIYMTNNSTVYAYKTVISDNTANNRGGGARIQGNAQLTLESCLVSGNSISGSYGGGIQLSSATPKLYCINTTITNNTANLHGAGINASCDVYLISCTVVNNKTISASSQGQDIRCESSDKMHFINSIITGENAGDPHIYLNGAGRKITSNGFNIFGNTGQSNGDSEFTAQTSDITAYYADVLGSNILANNNGYPQTIALKDNLQFGGASIAQLNDFKTTYSLSAGDVAKDQRGVARKETGAVSVGAYESGFATGIGNITQSAKYVVYPTRVTDNITVAGVKDARVAIVNMAGIQLFSTDKAKDVEYISMGNYSAGIYFVLIDGTVTKIIK